MSRWSGSSYMPGEGKPADAKPAGKNDKFSSPDDPTEKNWPQGKGRYTFPNGTIYEGEFDKGQFHGDGVLIYPKKVNRLSL